MQVLLCYFLLSSEFGKSIKGRPDSIYTGARQKMMWPLEMSRLINEYVGYMQTEAQIARDEVIEHRTCAIMIGVVAQMRRLGKGWLEYATMGANDYAERQEYDEKQNRETRESARQSHVDKFMRDEQNINPGSVAQSSYGGYGFIRD